MLNIVSRLKGFEVQATDGVLGTVSDFLFDDSSWKVRWMVVDTGLWLSGRKVLVHPSAVVSTEYGPGQMIVALKKAQVEGSPDISQDSPVSRQTQNDIYSYYGWDPLWGGAMFGPGQHGGPMYGGVARGAIASPLSAPVYFGATAVREAERGEVGPDDGDPHLRSMAEVTGYHVHATDGHIGHVEDFLVERDTWGVRYLVVDTSNWWIGQHVLISPHAVTDVAWSDRHIGLNIGQGTVRSSPPWNSTNTITGTFEKELRKHYDWPA
jgi:uncharacterized protein YrrD